MMDRRGRARESSDFCIRPIMSKTTMIHGATAPRSSLCTVLARIEVCLRDLSPILDRAQIAQKVVTHTPADKLYDMFIAILAGRRLVVVEIDTRLLASLPPQRTMGAARTEQSVVQETLDAYTRENVAQLHAALADVYR